MNLLIVWSELAFPYAKASFSTPMVTHEKDNWYKQANVSRIVKTQIALLFRIYIVFIKI